MSDAELGSVGIQPGTCPVAISLVRRLLVDPVPPRVLGPRVALDVVDGPAVERSPPHKQGEAQMDDAQIAESGRSGSGHIYPPMPKMEPSDSSAAGFPAARS